MNADALWGFLEVVLVAYGLIATVLLVALPILVANPPWHMPDPGKALQEKNIPLSWIGAIHPTDLNLAFQDVSFPTAADLTLRGWLISAANTVKCNPSPVAVACVHGAGRDRRAFLRHAVFLTEAGFDVLLFDCSNHGASDCLAKWPRGPWPGRAVSLGKREHIDVLSAVRFLKSRGSERVVVLGTSQGASSAIIASAKCDDINALILENPFSSPEILLRHVVTTLLKKIRVPFVGVVLTPLMFPLSLLHTGNFPSSEKAIDYVSDITIPVLFIHGTADALVHHRESEILYTAAATEHKELWLVENAPHTQCFHTRPEDYRSRVTKFLHTHVVDA